MYERPYLERHTGQRLVTVIGLSAVLGTSGAYAATLVPDFESADFASGALIDNRYFPLEADYMATVAASGIDADGEEFSEMSQLSYGGPGRIILGVQTSVQRDLAFEDGLLVEDTFDYYAQDTMGNVWYMGEDVVNFVYDEDDNLISTNNESAWIAGEDGALPGWIMSAEPTIGLAYFQEVAAANGALDEALIWQAGLTLEVGGSVFEDVIAIYETTVLDPEARELKYYAPGVGLIRVEEGLDENLSNPELVFDLDVVSEVPLPAGLPLFLATLLAATPLIRRCRKLKATKQI